ncbi:hypothetical protein P4O66_004606 [Electrophorus voltai]|uniref:CG-1 domain-containing protein n=1 Tax=Electrophorus voltai TaxID=2609070 RepID=A0AAD8ZNW7_9TELE|nr:hypothetical protein P4O66_004606 [Electrophorus voltai]
MGSSARQPPSGTAGRGGVISLQAALSNGSMILYNRKKVKYRKDGYCWKKRKDGKTTREDHMKLKVQGVEAYLVPYAQLGKWQELSAD